MSKSRKKKKDDLIEYMPCEWVVQFDDDLPQRFAYADETTQGKEVIIQLKNDNQSTVTFTDTKSGKQFKIFAKKTNMNNFKFFKGYNDKQLNQVDVSEMGLQTPVVNLYQPRRFNNVEFFYQFDDDEPVSFCTSTNDLHIHISPSEYGNISFNNNGKNFKIFAREINNEN